MKPKGTAHPKVCQAVHSKRPLNVSVIRLHERATRDDPSIVDNHRHVPHILTDLSEGWVGGRGGVTDCRDVSATPPHLLRGAVHLLSVGAVADVAVSVVAHLADLLRHRCHLAEPNVRAAVNCVHPHRYTVKGTALTFSAFMSQSTNVAPHSANLMASSLPRPCPAPVTRHTSALKSGLRLQQREGHRALMAPHSVNTTALST